jgi:hypothetical protein
LQLNEFTDGILQQQEFKTLRILHLKGVHSWDIAAAVVHNTKDIAASGVHSS